jgi:hypothetical protein
VTFPPGLDETRLSVKDEHVAQTVGKPSNNYASGPSDWDYRLHVLGFAPDIAVAAHWARVRRRRGAITRREHDQ